MKRKASPVMLAMWKFVLCRKFAVSVEALRLREVVAGAQAEVGALLLED